MKKKNKRTKRTAKRFQSNDQIRSGLDAVARRAGYDSYSRYMTSDHWRSFSKSYRESGLPIRCIACSYPNYELHHLRYDCLGKETLGDVMPLCQRCHDEAHEMMRIKEIPNYQTHLALQKIFKWTDQERIEKFKCFGEYWAVSEERARQRKVNKKEVKVYNPKNYYTLCNDWKNVVNYKRQGYTNKQISEVYNVSEWSVDHYMEQYKYLFE